MDKEENKLINIETPEYRGLATVNAISLGNRTPKQIDEDVEETISLLSDNHTWAEVTHIINGLRDYKISMVSLKRAYKSRVEKASYVVSMEDEKAAMIHDLDAIMAKAMKAYNISLEGVRTEQNSVEVNRLNGEQIGNPYQVVKITESAGDVKYLRIFMDAQERKRILLGGNDRKETGFNINLFFKGHEIYDGETPIELPIQSEEEAKRIDSNYE